MKNLLAALGDDEGSRAPNKIELVSYKEGAMLPCNGEDHLIWTIAIGKDHSATVLMHKDDYAKLKELADE